LFDEQQQRRREIRLKRPLIVLACAGGGLLLSLGLCGANLSVRGQAHYGEGILGGLGLVLFGISLLSLIGSFLWLVAAAIINAIRSN